MTMHAAYSPRGHRCGADAFRLAPALAAAGCAVGLCACGSSGGGPLAAGATNASGNASPAALSVCMRAHGISNFPDPGNGPGGQGLSISATPGSPTLTVNGITFSGPAFQKAETACRKYLTPSGPPPKPSAARLAGMLQFAKCMRANGVPSFADPPNASDGAVSGKRPTANTPAFRRAVRLCGRLRKR